MDHNKLGLDDSLVELAKQIVNESKHYDEGSMAALKGKKYSDNPYEKGSKEHLDWSKGHNASRAMRSEEQEELDERNKENAIKRKMMDASRGARWKVANKVSADDVRNWDGKHPTSQAQNKAIGRALRNEELTEEQMEEIEALAAKHGLTKE